MLWRARGKQRWVRERRSSKFTEIPIARVSTDASGSGKQLRTNLVVHDEGAKIVEKTIVPSLWRHVARAIELGSEVKIETASGCSEGLAQRQTQERAERKRTAAKSSLPGGIGD